MWQEQVVNYQSKHSQKGCLLIQILSSLYTLNSGVSYWERGIVGRCLASILRGNDGSGRGKTSSTTDEGNSGLSESKKNLDRNGDETLPQAPWTQSPAYSGLKHVGQMTSQK